MNAPATDERRAARWHPLTRIAFRFCFVYFTLYALCCGNATLWEMFPSPLGLTLEGLAALPFNHAAQWCGQHLFHLMGPAAHLHASGFNDRALDWVACGLMIAVALIATLVWSVLDRKRPNYSTLFTWLRFTLRLTLAAGMFVYAAMKLSPLQIDPPSLAILNEPVGSTSPLALLWTTLGLYPAYEILCGVMEFIAGVLLVFRRTALAGALLSGIILTNVVLFDFFFDVPVKLYSTNLLLMTLVVTAPDFQPLFRFFWSDTPARKTGGWTPELSNRNGRIAVLAVEALFLITLAFVLPLRKAKSYAVEAENLRHPSLLTGQWHIEPESLRTLLTGDGQPVTDIFLEPSGWVTLRAADGTLWDGSRTDYPHHQLRLMSPLRLYWDYTITQPDATHLILVSSSKAPRLTLTRVPLPESYRLQHRGLHLINEWGFMQ